MRNRVRKMVLCSLFAALTGVCAWISVPFPPVGFTLQTFGILLTLGLLGGKWGTVSIGLYLLLGLAGMPVFAGFRGGATALLDASGGFLWGFLLGGLGYRMVQRLGRIPGFVLCQLICYFCGCLWFSLYAGGGIGLILLRCVVPYLIPDGIKLWLAYALSKRLQKVIKLPSRT